MPFFVIRKKNKSFWDIWIKMFNKLILSKYPEILNHIKDILTIIYIPLFIIQQIKYFVIGWIYFLKNLMLNPYSECEYIWR
jgi:hypothetical protein